MQRVPWPRPQITLLVSLTPSVFNRAFEVWMEFGPERGRPIEDRWRERVPELDPSDYSAVSDRARTIERRAKDLGGQGLAGLISQEDVFQTLAAEYPDLSEDVVSRAGSQGFYFAMK